MGTHYWNPPLLMPLVETIAGPHTPRELLDAVLGLLRAIGKRPIVLEREATGLLWNRLQLAVLRECEWLVEHGVATPQTIDEVMRDGLARRWRLTGPFETVGLGGAKTFDAIAANLFPLLSSATAGRGFGRHVRATRRCSRGCARGATRRSRPSCEANAPGARREPPRGGRGPLWPTAQRGPV